MVDASRDFNANSVDTNTRTNEPAAARALAHDGQCRIAQSLLCSVVTLRRARDHRRRPPEHVDEFVDIVALNVFYGGIVTCS